MFDASCVILASIVLTILKCKCFSNNLLNVNELENIFVIEFITKELNFTSHRQNIHTVFKFKTRSIS